MRCADQLIEPYERTLVACTRAREISPSRVLALTLIEGIVAEWGGRADYEEVQRRMLSRPFDLHDLMMAFDDGIVLGRIRVTREHGVLEVQLRR